MVPELKRGDQPLDRPTSCGTVTTTPQAGQMMRLLGSGGTDRSVTVTKDEFRHIQKVYGYVTEPVNQKPPAPEPPAHPGPKASYDAMGKFYKDEADYKQALKAHDRWEDPREYLQAGADRNAFRHAQVDGLRMLAWIARYIEPGQDPLKTLIQMASDSGFDVDPNDYCWAVGEDGSSADPEEG